MLRLIYGQLEQVNVVHYSWLLVVKKEPPVPDPLVSVTLDSVYNDKTIEDDSVHAIFVTADDIGDSVKFSFSASAYPDSGPTHNMVAYVADITDTLGIVCGRGRIPSHIHCMYRLGMGF